MGSQEVKSGFPIQPPSKMTGRTWMITSGLPCPKKSGFPWQLMVMACSVPPHLKAGSQIFGAAEKAKAPSERPHTKAPSAHSRVYSLHAGCYQHETASEKSKWTNRIFMVLHCYLFMFKPEHQCFKGNGQASARNSPRWVYSCSYRAFTTARGSTRGAPSVAVWVQAKPVSIQIFIVLAT